ncbi:hypothetical protein P4S72_16700 [Vibrio sp. PP-XX7]
MDFRVAQAAPPVDLIVNGDFETGDFTGWDVSGTGSGNYRINDGAFNPAGPAGVLPAVNGNYDAVGFPKWPFSCAASADSLCAGWCFFCPFDFEMIGFVIMRVHFLIRVKEYRVLILDAANTVLQEVHSTNTGDELLQIGPNARGGNLHCGASDVCGSDDCSQH